ncbi:MAG TPA: pantetheine-phosphate adenylyltransferase [Verrucomicrobiae bacterium]|jgi:pantetheine-phosphate adenylyltransferase|nr:pantetheine-phosphate adenylyltransferase [Verrucomicrobiae bacterium]
MADHSIAVYPGTFDPITNGHMDIIRRAADLTDHLIIAVAKNAGKNPLLTVDDRLALVRAEIADLNKPGRKVEARTFDTLLMHFAESVGAGMIVRGLRAVSDFEYEFQMAGMNARLNPRVETVFLMASETHQFISSRFVKEIGRLGGDISSFVSARVAAHLVKRFAAERKDGNHAKGRVQTLEDSV